MDTKNTDYDFVGEKFFNPELYKNENNYTLNKAFAISNEMLPKVFENLKLKNKKVLTVGSSGDQALNAILNGCQNVSIIDANIFTEPFVEYKLALIKTFDFKTFNDLFIKPRAFDWKVYAKISHHLSPKTKQFWDTLMLDLTSNAQWGEFTEKDITSKMLNIDHTDRHSAFYKDENVYKLLQTILNNKSTKISFINAEFKQFPNMLKNKYDLIYLSNIYDYYKKNKDEFIAVVDLLHKNNLNNGGSIYVNYDFDGHTKVTPQTLGEHNLTTKKIKRNSIYESCTDTLWIINKNDDEMCK